MRWRPLPTICPTHPSSTTTPNHLQSVPIKRMKSMHSFLRTLLVTFLSLTLLMHHQGFNAPKSDNSIVFFNLTYVDGFPVIFESIKVDQSLHVQLQFNGHPVPLPAWFTKGRNATLTRFSQLNNFPNAIRVVSEETECSRSLLNEMLDISNYQAKGRPPYSSAMIRFALHLRYTSLQSYKVLLEKFPLPSISTLHRIQACGVDSLKAAKKLREKGHISSCYFDGGWKCSYGRRQVIRVEIMLVRMMKESFITHTASFKHTVSGMCGQHILKFLIGFLPRLTFVVQNITTGDWNLLQR